MLNNFLKQPLTLILVLALALRIISLNQSLWLDEATSVLVARDMSVSGILTQFSPSDFHPPFYYLLLKVWGNMFGFSEVGVRMLSVLVGVATVWIVAQIGNKIFNYKTGLLASLFLATAPLHLYYSQEARMYALETFFAALLVYLFLKFREAAPTYFNSTCLALTGVLLLYTDYLPGFLLISGFIYLFVFESKFVLNNLLKIIAILLGVTVLYLPWLPTLFNQIAVAQTASENAKAWIDVLGKTSFKGLALVPIKFAIGRVSFFNKTLYGAIVAIVFVILSIPLIDTYKTWKKTQFLWFCFLVPVFLAAVLGSLASGFSYFRLLFVLPIFYLLIAAGIQNTNSKGLQKVTILLVVLMNLIFSFVYLLNPKFHREDWSGAVKFIEQKSEGKNALSFFVTKNQRDAYLYYSDTVQSRWFDPKIQWKPTETDTIWFFRYVQPIFDPEDLARKEIETGYEKIGEFDFNGVIVWEYTKKVTGACLPGGGICNP